MLISVSIFCSIAKRQKFEKQIVWFWRDNRQIESIIGLRSEKPEKALPEDKPIMSEIRFSEFLALSVYPKLGFSHSASVNNFLAYYWKKPKVFLTIFLLIPLLFFKIIVA